VGAYYTGYGLQVLKDLSQAKKQVPVLLVRDRYNAHDKNAVKVYICIVEYDDSSVLAPIGFVQRHSAKALAEKMDTHCKDGDALIMSINATDAKSPFANTYFGVLRKQLVERIK
jgi:HIRAN domain